MESSNAVVIALNFHSIAKLTVQSPEKSQLQGFELEEDFAFYIVFEECFLSCINNPVSAIFSLG